MTKFSLTNAIKKSVNESFKDDKLISSEGIKRNITVLEELENFIPALTKEEFSGLETNIIENGCRSPLIIWQTKQNTIDKNSESNEPVFVLIDGHNRFKICKKNNIDFSIDLLTFKDIDAVKDFMIDFQINRRNITKEQASYLRGMKYNQQKRKVGERGFDNLKHDPKKILAQQFKVSESTISRDSKYAKGLDLLDEPTKTSILKGEKKIPKTVIENLKLPTETIERESPNVIKKINIDIKFLKQIISIKTGEYFISKANFRLTDDGIYLNQKL